MRSGGFGAGAEWRRLGRGYVVVPGPLAVAGLKPRRGQLDDDFAPIGDEAANEPKRVERDRNRDERAEDGDERYRHGVGLPLPSSEGWSRPEMTSVARMN